MLKSIKVDGILMINGGRINRGTITDTLSKGEVMFTKIAQRGFGKWAAVLTVMSVFFAFLLLPVSAIASDLGGYNGGSLTAGNDQPGDIPDPWYLLAACAEIITIMIFSCT